MSKDIHPFELANTLFGRFVDEEFKGDLQHPQLQHLMGWNGFLQYEVTWPQPTQGRGLFTPGFTSKAEQLLLPVGFLQIMDLLMQQLRHEVDSSLHQGRRSNQFMSLRNQDQGRKAVRLLDYCKYWFLIFLSQPLNKKDDLIVCDRLTLLIHDSSRAFTLAFNKEIAWGWYDRIKGGYAMLADMQAQLHKAVGSFK